MRESQSGLVVRPFFTRDMSLWTAVLQGAAAVVGAFVLWVCWLHYKSTLAPVPGGKRIPGPPQVPLFGNVLALFKHSKFQYAYMLSLVKQYVSGTSL